MSQDPPIYEVCISLLTGLFHRFFENVRIFRLCKALPLSCGSAPFSAQRLLYPACWSPFSPWRQAKIPEFLGIFVIYADILSLNLCSFSSFYLRGFDLKGYTSPLFCRPIGAVPARNGGICAPDERPERYKPRISYHIWKDRLRYKPRKSFHYWHDRSRYRPRKSFR